MRILSVRLAPSAVLATLLGVFAACSPVDAQSKKAEPRELTGEVRFVGKVPNGRILDRSIEPNCENGTAYAENILSWDGKLANVHVSIVTDEKTKPPKKPVIVQQADCIYVPRVQGLIRGQKVLVLNGDPNMHNVHAKSGTDSLTNKSQPAKAPPLEIDYSSAKDVLSLGCDVHRWMRAYMPITDHAYFDVTGPDGSFEIRGLKPGATVKVRAWHEKLGTQTKEGVVGEPLTFSFAQL